VGDKTVLLGVGVVEWDVPPELNAVFLQLEQLKREAAAKAAAAAAAPGPPDQAPAPPKAEPPSHK
jgi:hypothetical protein